MSFTRGLLVFLCRVPRSRQPTLFPQCHEPLRGGMSRASNMWQPEQAAIMCAALRGHAAALPRARAAQSSSSRPVASLAMLHGGPRTWCCVIVALEPHTSALCMYDRGGAPELTIRLADQEALHLGTERRWGRRAVPPGDLGGCSGSAGTTEETPSASSWLRPWRRGSGRFVAPGGPSRATGRSSPIRGAGGWKGIFFPWRG